MARIRMGTAIMIAGMEVVFQKTVKPCISDVGSERNRTRFVAAIRLPRVTNETVAAMNAGHER